MIDIKKLENIKYICFGIGGSNGWVFSGVLLELYRYLTYYKKPWIYNQLKGAAGASVGSYFALMMVLNFTPFECIIQSKRVLNKYKSQLADVNIMNLTQQKGIIDNQVLTDMAQEAIKIKYPNDPNLTFKQLFEKTNKILKVTAHNMSNNKNQVFDYINSPDLEICKAITMSCAIPIVFHAYQYNNNLYVDSGVSNAFPIDVFPPESTLGFHIFYESNYINSENMTLSFFLNRLIGTLDLITKEKIKHHPYQENIVIIDINLDFIPNNNHGSFNLEDASVTKLIQLGEITMIKELCPIEFEIISILNYFYNFKLLQLNKTLIED